MNPIDIAQAIGSIATAAGVLLALWQLRRGQQQATTQFEDELAREYREIVHQLPVDALLGQALAPNLQRSFFRQFFCYIDLSNEQVFLRQQGRVNRQTWMNWCDGIKTNLMRPAFKAVWDEIKASGTSFQELRRLEEDCFLKDPKDWGPRHFCTKLLPLAEQRQQPKVDAQMTEVQHVGLPAPALEDHPPRERNPVL